MLKLGKELDDRYLIFFGSFNSDKAKFGSKSDSDNRNVKNVMFGFKIRTKNSCPLPDFFRVGTNSDIQVGQIFASTTQNYSSSPLIVVFCLEVYDQFSKAESFAMIGRITRGM